MMPLDDYVFRPITFQGITFPATLMGISILEPVLDIQDEDLGDWLWRLPICCGFPKHTSGDRCTRCAQKTLDLMLEHRQLVLDGIRERLAPLGFDPESTYNDWLLALQKIVELSSSAVGDCVWFAPSHPRDTVKSEADVHQFIDYLDRHGPRNT